MTYKQTINAYIEANPELRTRAVAIGEQFRLARESENLSKADIAQRSNLSVRQVASVENGSYILKFIAPIQMYLDACESDMMININLVRTTN